MDENTHVCGHCGSGLVVYVANDGKKYCDEACRNMAEAFDLMAKSGRESQARSAARYPQGGGWERGELLPPFA